MLHGFVESIPAMSVQMCKSHSFVYRSFNLQSEPNLKPKPHNTKINYFYGAL